MGRPPAQPRCAAESKQTGKPCGNRALPGTTVCRYHGGKAPQVQAAAKKRLLAAEATAELARLGVAVETTPIEALEAMLWEAAGNVVVLRDLVAHLPLQATVRGDWDPVDNRQVTDDQPGIYGATYHESGKATGKAEPHVLVVMYDAERDRLAKLAEACAKLGLDERRVQLAEVQVERLFAAVTRALRSIPAEYNAQFRAALAEEIRKTS